MFALRRKSEEKETVHKTDLFVSGSGLGLSAAVEQGKGKGDVLAGADVKCVPGCNGRGGSGVGRRGWRGAGDRVG